ncbi:MAG: YggS family pyridoxal phosphate-dependent enzyme, partial [Candidatus Marinimicrobia bacterium]|nr:YggS family pyridoxal phosphate-dependent enzyme [Candidatus Neomarinimicrobiota bacterium]
MNESLSNTGNFSTAAHKQALASITAAKQRSPFAVPEVCIVAVTKAFPVDALITGFAAGHRLFGESRVQEAAKKLPAFPERDQCRIHMIGHLQSNKAKQAIDLFDLIESVDSLKLFQRLDRLAGEAGKQMPIYLQVNTAHDEAKTGFSPGALIDSVDEFAAGRHTTVQGIMTIAPFAQDSDVIRECFGRARQLRDELRKSIPSCTDLSMGMSVDYELAVEEGATHVRLGSRLFGPRP